MENQLRKSWLAVRQEMTLNAPVDVPSTSRKTILQKLIARYRTFVIIEALNLIYIPLLLLKLLPEHDIWQWILMALYEVIMLVSLITDLWLHSWLGKINVEQMSVYEVIKRCALARKRHLQFLFVMLPFSVITIALTAYVFSDDIYIVIGIITGTLIGMCVAITFLRQFLRDYKALMHI